MMGGIAKFVGRFLKRESGASMVEFTLVAPIVVALGLGAGEFGRAIQHNHAVTKGARDAARYLARVPVTCTGGTGSITDAQHTTNARNLAIYGDIAGGTPIISYWTDSNTVTIDIGCYDNSAQAYHGREWIADITVLIAVPYQDMGFLDALGVSGSLTLTARHQQIHIGE